MDFVTIIAFVALVSLVQEIKPGCFSGSHVLSQSKYDQAFVFLINSNAFGIELSLSVRCSLSLVLKQKTNDQTD